MGRDFAELVASEFEAALARDPAARSARLRGAPRQGTASAGGDHLSRTDVDRARGHRGAARHALPGFRRRGGPAWPRSAGQAARAAARSARSARRRSRPRGGPPPDGGGMPRMPFGPPRRGPVMAPIQHNDTVVAMVWVPPLTGLRRVRRCARHAARARRAVLLLIAGTAIAALVIFRPAQARLRALEDAADRFGEGDLTARAPAIGGDEVAAVAEAFNRMADRSGGAPGAARRGRSRPPAAARRRVARADDAAHRDPRLCRDAGAAAVHAADDRKDSAPSR